MPWAISVKLVLFYTFGLYKGMWRFTGLSDIWRLAQACFVAEAGVVAMVTWLHCFAGYSRGGLCYRRHPDLCPGRGAAPGHSFLLHKKGRNIHGLPVLGPIKDVRRVVDSHQVAEVLIALPAAGPERIKEVVHEIGFVPYQTVLGYVHDKDLISQLFARYHPQMVIQAAEPDTVLAASKRAAEVLMQSMPEAREMIRLSGREPDEDITIQYTGLEFGEQIAGWAPPGDEAEATEHSEIMVLWPATDPFAQNGTRRNRLPDLVAGLSHAAKTMDKKAIEAGLRNIVPEYTGSDTLTVLQVREKKSAAEAFKKR
ncbi:MAG: hypothetical protein U5L00_17220 [Desulfovermiculus sp.]|nr:hypothetical protein [Desulfovermiculus sp.]